MSSQEIRTVIPAHRFEPEFRGSDGDGDDFEDGLCCHLHHYRHHLDGPSKEFCSETIDHSVHHGVDQTWFERCDGSGQ